MNEEKSWTVIKFPNENDSVAAVPTCWIRGNRCYWPPDRIESSIKNHRQPDFETWENHPFQSLRSNVFDDFQTARRKMQMATEKSDLDSHCETQNEERNSKGRKLVKTSFTRYTSFEVSEEDSPEACTLPAMPKFKGVTKKRKLQLQTSARMHDENEHICEDEPNPEINAGIKKYYRQESICEDDMRNVEKTAFDAGSSKSSKHKGSSGSQENVCEGDFHVPEKRKKVHFVEGQMLKDVTNKSGKDNANSGRVVANQSDLDQHQIAEYLKKIIRKQNIIQSTLTDLAEEVLEIKNRLGDKHSNVIDEESMFEILNLPVNCDEDLKKLEDFLHSDVAMNRSVKEVASSGGKTVYDLVYRSTQKLITNTFAARFSYYGRQKKQKFIALKLNELLKKVAMKVFPNCTEKEAEVDIAKWLRRCMERSKKEM